jgi:hypothetical protein
MSDSDTILKFNEPEIFRTWCAHVDKDIIDVLVEHGFEKPEMLEREPSKKTSRCVILYTRECAVSVSLTCVSEVHGIAHHSGPA